MLSTSLCILTPRSVFLLGLRYFRPEHEIRVEEEEEEETEEEKEEEEEEKEEVEEEEE